LNGKKLNKDLNLDLVSKCDSDSRFKKKRKEKNPHLIIMKNGNRIQKVNEKQMKNSYNQNK